MTVETSLDDTASYQWYHDGKIIDGATSKDYTIQEASKDSVGKYSVVVTSSSGIEKTIDICNVIKVNIIDLLSLKNIIFK